MKSLSGPWSPNDVPADGLQRLAKTPTLAPTPLEALALGWSIIPTNLEKRPMVATWTPYQSQLPTKEQVEIWDKMLPAGWAVITGPLSRRITFDFDGQDGLRSYEALGMPPPHRRTPRGYHLDFVHPSFKVTTLNSKSKKELNARWPGLDIRGDGGYAIFRGKSKYGEYQWISDSLEPYPWDPALWERIFPPEQTPPPAEKEAGEPHMKQKANGQGQRRVDSLLLIRRALDMVARGEGRNNAGAWLAMQLRDNGYSRSEVLAVDWPARCPETNAHGNLELYTAREWQATVDSIFNRPARDPWSSQKTGDGKKTRNGASAPATDKAQSKPPSVAVDLLWGYNAGDVGNGERLLAIHETNVLCDDRRGGSPVWYRWEGKRWQEVSEGVIRELAHQVGVEYVKQAAEWRSDNTDKNLAKAEEELVLKTATSYLTTKRLNNAITEARPYVLVKVEDFDSNHNLLNFSNGTLDTAADPPQLREHRRRDRITRLIDFDYDPNATCPEFLRFLRTTMGGNPDSAEDTPEQQVATEMIAYLQQIFGCTLSADVRDKNIFIFNGDTDTGKTTLLATVHGVIPDYTVTIPIETLMTEDRNSSIEESLFSLRGKRMAITSETGRYHTLNVARIKQITQGNDRAEISVVPKYKPQITFEPTHHLFIDCNFRPRIRGGDDATWNRLRILNFPHRIPPDQQIKNMTEILLKERQGIMTWMIQGLVAFRNAGMKLPTVEDIETRLKAWRKESEPLRDFLDAKCWLESEWTGTIDGAAIALPEDWEWTVAQNELWRSYSEWRTQEGEKRMKKVEFYGDIESLPGVRRGRPYFGKKTDRTQRDGFFGIALKKI